ncbi:hypothetical protein FW778_16220 [Ginsengibacter hankyongi]|uniref:Uncharacterized protein n=1 Tax=Ginsengibacter hankyongi TaxID=2607284 RepID=A0A5J5IFK8_9BACT|nr:hypothetical protein [Ginsengibacter hankyongi]KAA9037639.1 hypothetical protein FW778_16220 [Ginsengibacter hankyongi]
MRKSIFIILSLIVLHKISLAQDTLPKISVTQLGTKVLVSWVNPFNSLTTINIQRSYDSLKNFTTIGSVLNVSARNNGFVDSKEFIPSQYYRVFISFEGGTYMFTQSHRPGIDTSKTIAEVNEIKEIVKQGPPVQTFFIPSKLVYTGKENNVIISLPDANKKKYSIKFFENDGTPIFEIKKITEPYLTLDKVNFIHAGLFNFELYADGALVERHKFYIPKDGQPMPALDVNGYLIK